ncbi:MAG: helix-turn-helix transcriptional regulator [Mycobacterium sp.]|nr:helix-turn-helix transcriptional regulator [Mycobacterium sp.]
MDDAPPARGHDPHAQLIANVINELFAVCRSRDGRPLTKVDLAQFVQQKTGSGSRNWLYKILAGEKIPTFPKLAAIAEFFGVDISVFDPHRSEQVMSQLQLMATFRNAMATPEAARLATTINDNAQGLTEQDFQTLTEMVEFLVNRTNGNEPGN